MVWNFQKIEYFLKVTEEKSMSEAARKMFFTPQALNKHLKQLEAELGVKLINRDRGRISESEESVSLTAAGEQMKNYFMPCYKEYVEAVNRMENYLCQRKSKLRIAYFRGIKKNEMMMPLFQYLSETGEFESIELISGELGEVLEWIEEENCDIGLTNIHDAEQERENLYYIPVKKMPAKIIISDMHPWAKKTSVTAEDMAQETMVILKWGAELEKGNFWKKAKVKRRKEVRDVDSIFAEIKTGKSFGVMLPYFEGDYDNSFIQLDLPEKYAFSFSFCIVFRKDSYFQNTLEEISENIEDIWGVQ